MQLRTHVVLGCAFLSLSCADAPTAEVPSALYVVKGSCPEAVETGLCPAPPETPQPEDLDETPLTVTMQPAVFGENWVNYRVYAAGPAVHSVTVTGGSGYYYYHWVAQVCTTDGGMEQCGMPHTFAEGTGLSSVTYNYAANVVRVELTVEVREAGTPHLTGVGAQGYGGPAMLTPVSENLWRCKVTPNWYPFVDMVPVWNPSTNTWEMVPNPKNGPNYVRNRCTGGKDFQPKAP